MIHRIFSVSVLIVAVWTVTACSADETHQRLFIIGQDLGSVRDYYASGCCPQADGNTAYLNFYALASRAGGFGGLGIDLEGEPVHTEFDWGAGPANAWKSATEFPGGFAIGLSMPENNQPDGLAQIIAGDHDASIRQLARFVSMIEGPVYLRVGYEFDGGWNAGYENHENFIAAYRRIVDGLRAAGTRNVEYVWQSAASPLNDLDGYRDGEISRWYPGDNYVDWVALSYFMHPDERPRVKTSHEPRRPRQLIDEVLDFARHHGKPVMIAEAAPQGYDLARGSNANIGGIWDGPQAADRRQVGPREIWEAWFAPLFELMEENSDVIYALAYINCNWDVQDMWDAPYESGYWGDSRLQVSPVIAERFSEAIERWRALP